MHDLPVELWRQIFEYAIHDSKLLDPLYDSPVPSLQQATYDRIDHLRHSSRSDSITILGEIVPLNSVEGPGEARIASTSPSDMGCDGRRTPTLRSIQPQISVDTKTKLAIVSTSSQWRKIGLPYLFQAVTLSSLRQLELLTALVRASRYRYVPGPHNIKLFREGKRTGYGIFIRRIETRIDCMFIPYFTFFIPQFVFCIHSH